MSYVDEALNDPEWLESLKSGVYSYEVLKQELAITRAKTEQLREKVEQ